MLLILGSTQYKLLVLAVKSLQACYVLFYFILFRLQAGELQQQPHRINISSTGNDATSITLFRFLGLFNYI